MENRNSESSSKNPWLWVPSLYFGQGIPYVTVMMVATVMYKRMGVSNTELALYTSWLYLPWVIKPFWSPLVEVLQTKRWWIVAMQLLIGAGLAGVAYAIPGDNFLGTTMAFLWLLAFSSATHDVAADGFYLVGLDSHEQAWFVGLRSTFFRLALIAGQGLLVMLAGRLETRSDNSNIAGAWSTTFYVAAAVMVILGIYHWICIPRLENDRRSVNESSGLFKAMVTSVTSFFAKPYMGLIIAYVLTYRLGEAQLGKLATPFLLDARDKGGLEMPTEWVGFAYGTVGVLCLLAGGILGGWLAARDGLKRWLWVMVAAINLPNLSYVLLAYIQPENRLVILTAIAVEQFGYGVGFTAFMLYLMYAARGENETVHYALCTG
ncbi:MAG: MFS transporter, partial [Planctomycetota bacterium]